MQRGTVEGRGEGLVWSIGRLRAGLQSSLPRYMVSPARWGVETMIKLRLRVSPEVGLARALGCRWMDDPQRDDERFVDRLSRQGEEALGRLAEELIGNPVVNGALTRAFEAREKAVQAQEAAMGALNIPSAADIERVTRRLRSVSQRLEGIEDAIDRLEDRHAAATTRVADEERAAATEERLEEIARDLAALREAVVGSEEPIPRAQERLTVSES